MSAAARRAAREEALARVAGTHRSVAAILADLRREIGAPSGGDEAPEKAAELLAPVAAPHSTSPDVEPEREAEAETEPQAESDAWRVVEQALSAGRTPRQRFGDPYCPAPVCYGRDYRVLDVETVTAEGVPPYAPDCNCTVIVD